MKSKKAFLLGEHTLKIIIAVLCLLLLIYVLYSLYSNSQDERNRQLAKSSLAELEKEMNEAKTSPQILTLLTPSNWILLNYAEKSTKPKACEGNCVCLCPEEALWIKPVNMLTRRCNQECMCEGLGVCKNFDEVISMGSIKLPVDININFEDDKFTIKK